MNKATKRSYPTKAKVEFAVAMAREVAGIDQIGAIVFGPDGSIRVERKTESVADEYEQWKAGRGRK
ncbi:hypothetical protein [Stakelama tenebrarum]|uniref:Uncharacterized protein n=1 Tax=Stakelama tenebrarum TaxID=2711215 RepID=A0A6G6Y527_9SPHN|nr:hypothetical protein [Sphingosinithalassobacter tenebrarum]QIG79951.1 hypothetical protein G5C33_09300 [Sphingosinithalassobacter tenebrarum]